MRASLCCVVLSDAGSHYSYQSGLILHSDSTPAATSVHWLRNTAWSAKRGTHNCCFDNARMESFFSTLKKIWFIACVASPYSGSRFGRGFSAGLKPIYSRLRCKTANGGKLPPLRKRAVDENRDTGSIVRCVVWAIFLTISASWSAPVSLFSIHRVPFR